MDFITAFLIGVASTLTGGFLVAQRKKKIKQKIHEIDEQEKHLEKISEDNHKFIKYCFAVIVVFFAVLFSIIFLHSLHTYYDVPHWMSKVFRFSVVILSASAIGFGTLVMQDFFAIKDMSSTKEKLSKKREKLKAKLED